MTRTATIPSPVLPPLPFPANAPTACTQGVDPDLFFPSSGGSFAAALAVCASCQLLTPCQEWAYANPALRERESGVFGGTTPDDRRLAANVARPTRTECTHGHRYTADNTQIRRDGTRNCRTCARARDAAKRRRQQDARRQSEGCVCTHDGDTHTTLAGCEARGCGCTAHKVAAS